MDARYSRHAMLKEIGKHGQDILCKSTIAVIGVGGVGCSAAAVLAGLGTNLVLCDNDVVDETNLNRQFAYGENDIGLWKAEAAKRYLHRLNPKIKVRTAHTPNKIKFRHTDVVIDSTDNLEARIGVSKMCKASKVPLVYASATGYEARVSVFRKKYLHELAIWAENTSSVRQARGIFPPAASIAGSLAASEAVKIILGIGRAASGKMLVLNCLKNEARLLKI